MPIYRYQEIQEDGTPGEIFEAEQRISDPALTTHPQTGRPVRRLLQAPGFILRYSDRAQKAKTETSRAEKAGFTKYERDPSSGLYHKVAGQDPRAPGILHRPPGS